MKRTVKPFVVERKRRAAGAGDGPPSIWSKADGDAFRDVAKVARPEDAPAKPAAPRPVAHATAEPRILAAKAAKPAPEAPPPIAEEPPRTKRQRARRMRPEGEIGEQTATPIADAAPAGVIEGEGAPPSLMLSTAAPESVPPSVEDGRVRRLREKRAAARKRLPLHERWKWDLPN
ncbi:hypothetical protein [Aureimonas sp. SK2]|uniref:hypothetical protein n=1 Tax=Aureimonas sp. SK2 TaxID=3015992 RepID=UPI0024444C77|nr:hypothetical protein [Aureimonas sp. SK2]